MKKPTSKKAFDKSISDSLNKVQSADAIRDN